MSNGKLLTADQSAPFVTFEELARAEWARGPKHQAEPQLTDQERADQERADQEREVTREEFQKMNGIIVEEIWAPRGGAVLTWKRHARPSQWWKPWTWWRGEERRLHHRTPAALVSRPDLYPIERRLTALAAMAHDALRGLPRTILLDQIFCLLSSLYEYVENEKQTSGDGKWATTARTEVAKIERDYKEAATRSAQVDYIQAMVVGWVLLGIIGAAILGIWKIIPVAVTSQLFFAALLGGGMGAFVSVLIRMSSNRFRILREPSRTHTWTLGALRPLIGAVFGVVVYFVAISGLLQVTAPAWEQDRYKALAWIVSVSFVAGFSERFAKNVFESVEGSVSAAEQTDDKTGT